VKVTVEWLDGVVRTYEHVDDASNGTDQVLRLYSKMSYGMGKELIAAIPYGGVREWKVGGR
jgi:hypothetical protein